jgi:two-component system cell cycle response regulator
VTDKRQSGTLILTTPAEPVVKARQDGEACIVLLHPPGPDIGKRTPLKERAYIIGRDTDADLVIGRSSVSRQHSRLAQDDAGEWSLADLGSTNGTFVNEERIEVRHLLDGDQLRFGDAIFKFLSGTNVESAYHEEIYRMTIVDGLTGIHNKRYFLEFLERELAVASRHRHPLTLVMFDVDHFKKVNDDHGHLGGDAVLKELTGRIRHRIRREDLFARYGGEEFACVLASTGLEGGVVFAEHIRNLIAERPCTFENRPIPITVSLGVAAVGRDTVDALGLIREADERLYRAKREGRNRVVPSLADLLPDSVPG